MSHKSRIRKPVRSDDLARKDAIIKDVIHNKMAPFLKAKEQSAAEQLNEKLKHLIEDVRKSMLPIMEQAGKTGLFNTEANRSILASLLIERFDKMDKDELVNTITMIMTEEILNSL